MHYCKAHETIYLEFGNCLGCKNLLTVHRVSQWLNFTKDGKRNMDKLFKALTPEGWKEVRIPEEGRQDNCMDGKHENK